VGELGFLAIAEPDEDLAVARLAFLVQGDHAALDAAIDACLARSERTLYTRWRHRLPGPDPLRGPADPGSTSCLPRRRPSGDKVRAPGSSRGPRRGDQSS
jgi:hypothetical protein